MKKLLMTLSVCALAAQGALAGHHENMETPEIMAAKDLRSKGVDYFAKEGLGKKVYNGENHVATVADMGITGDGSIKFVVLDVDNDMSTTDDQVAVKHSALKWNEAKDKLMIHATKEQLKAK